MSAPRPRSQLLVGALAVVCAVGCAATRPPPPAPSGPPNEGFIQVEGGKVWYRVVGSGPKTPLLVLHGGPGIPHDYLETLGELGDDRKVVFYDQLGCGKSDRPDNTSLWTIERFTKELQQVRDALHLDHVVLYGHSWGTILAVEYALGKPSGVEGLVLAGPALSVPKWDQDAARLLSELPPEQQKLVAQHDQGQKVDEKAYQAVVDGYYKLHVCRLNPWPKLLTDSLDGMGQQVYQTMDGPNEFTTRGSLKGLDLTPRLGELHVPVLLTCGRYDEATPETSKSYADAIPGSQLVVFQNSSHTPHLEEQALYEATLRAWLTRIDPSIQ